MKKIFILIMLVAGITIVQAMDTQRHSPRLKRSTTFLLPAVLTPQAIAFMRVRAAMRRVQQARQEPILQTSASQRNYTE